MKMLVCEYTDSAITATTRGDTLTESIVLVDKYITDVHVKELRSLDHLQIDPTENLLLQNWKQVAEQVKGGATGSSLAGERASRAFAVRVAEYLIPDVGSTDVRMVAYSSITRSYPQGGDALFWFVPEAIRRRRQYLGMPGVHSQWILYGEATFQQRW